VSATTDSILSIKYFALHVAMPLLQQKQVHRLEIRSADDTLAEWLRRRPAKPMGFPRVGSNPTGVVCFHSSHYGHAIFM
jgi:hypothetical protein